MAMEFIFGTASRRFEDFLEIQILLGTYVKKTFIDSYSVIFPPLQLDQLKMKKAKNGMEIYKIQVSFYYMTYNSVGVEQFAW